MIKVPLKDRRQCHQGTSNDTSIPILFNAYSLISSVTKVETISFQSACLPAPPHSLYKNQINYLWPSPGCGSSPDEIFLAGLRGIFFVSGKILILVGKWEFVNTAWWRRGRDYGRC